MLSLDLFNTKYERELREGAVDDLEARRIDILNDRMQDLLGRAKESHYKNNPAALAGLKREYQRFKDERDSYYKVREAGIPGNIPTEKIPGKEDLLKGKGRSYYEGTEENDDWYDANGRPNPRGAYDVSGNYYADREDQDAGYDAYKERNQTSEATGDSKFDAMMGKISKDPWTQLNSDPDWQYEIEELVDQQIEPWLLAMEKGGMPITRDEETLNPGWRKRYEQVANKLAQEFLTSRGLNPRDPDLVGKIRYAIDWHTDESKNVHGQLSAYSDLPMQRYAGAFDADGMTANMRDAMVGFIRTDDDDDDEPPTRPMPDNDPRRLDPGNIEEDDDWMTRNRRFQDRATQDRLDHEEEMRARSFDRFQRQYQRQTDNPAAGVDLGRWLKPYQMLEKNNFEPIETKDRFEYLMQVALKLKGTGAGFDGWTGMSTAARLFKLDPREQKLVANLIRNSPRIKDLETYMRDSLSEAENAISTDAKGRTQQQWIKLVQTKFPTAKIMQAKMINGPVFATLPNGRKISWKKVETSNDQKKNPALGEKKLGQLRPTLGTGRDIGKSVRKFRAQRGLDEYISMGSDKNYQEAEPYKNYRIYVRKKPFGTTGMYTAHTEIDRKEFMGKGSSQEEAVQAIRDRIDFVLNAQRKVTGSSTIDFNVKFATDLLADPRQTFYAKLENINGEPKLVIASAEVAGDPELLAAGDFKRSALRNQVDDSGRATPLPGIPLTAKGLRSGDWIANGRYTVGKETQDRDGNRVFDLTYHSTAHTKSDKLRLNQPAFTLGTAREVDEHGGGIGPRQHWQDLMPEQTNPEDDDWYDDEEDQETELRSGDYVRDTMDGESGEVFRMQGDPYERRVRILDRDGKGWYIEPARLTRVDPQEPDVQRYFGKKRVRDMDEAVDEKGALKSAQAAAKFIIRNLDDRAALKYYSQDFWSPEKFYQGATMAMRGAGYDEIVKQITQDRPAQFESGVAEGWSDAIVSRRTGTPRTPYAVYIKGQKWKDFENEDHARAVMDKLKAKFAADGRDPETVTIAPTDMSESRATKTRLDKTHNNLTESKTYKLWESAGRKIVEAQLTAAQIQQIFQQAEQGATAAGTNRTGLGQVKDAGSAVAQAWAQLKTKVANSGPVKNIDAYYDQAAEKLRQATGGDQGVMQYVEKYRTFAKAHPVAQSLIYSALIAAAGISGAGAGGAAALALLKMTDKLLQGEKFSSAAYSGAKTGALAYGASLLKDLMSGTQGVTTSVEDPEWEKLRFQGDLVSVNQVVTTTNGTSTFKEVIQSIVGPNSKGEYLVTIVNNDDLREFVTKTPPPSVATGATESKKYSKSKLTETQIKRVFQVAGRMQDQLNEGMWDSVKNTAKGLANKAAGAVVNKAQTIGTNLTTKVTADKLMTAWKKAGSPLDSEQVKVIMKQSGVADNIIAATMPTQTTTTTAPVASNGRVAGNPTQPMSVALAEEQDSSGVERAILNRIMVSHIDLLKQFGPDKVMQAAEEVAYNVGDVDEIGTSDVSAYVAQVKQILGAVA
jgi:hypothetical protein